MKKQEEKYDEVKATNTAFILMFPALLLAGIAVFYAVNWLKLLVLALTVYQFILLKKFIQDYYKK
jgi:hypothetical protein